MSVSKNIIPLFLVLGAGLVVPLQAAELETVVVTGRAVETNRNDIAGSVGLVDALDISVVAATHINEIADRIAGVWISRGNGQEHLTAIRSPVFTGPGSCGSFLVLQDGIPTRPAGFCNVNQLFEINSEQADRIEIFRGPNGGVYGNNALHGIINVISPAVGEVEKGSIALDAGPHDYARGFFSYTDGQSLRINAHGDHDDGYKDDSGFDQQKVNIKHVNNKDDIRVETFAEFTNLNQETAGYIEGDDAYKDDSKKKDNGDPQSFRDAKAAHAYARFSGPVNDQQQWQITPYANTSRMEFLQHWVPTDPLEQNGHDSAGVNGRWSYPLAVSNQRAISTVSGFNLEMGRAYVDEFQSRATLFGFVQGQHYDFDTLLSSAALFSEMEYDLKQNLKMIAGIRYDYQYYDYDSNTAANTVGNYTRLSDRDDEFGNVGVNAGLIWKWFDQQQVFLNASTGYRAPEVAELYRLEGGVPADAVESEQIESVELGFRGEVKPRMGKNFFYELSFFDMQKDHVILKKADRQYLGDGETSHRGMEIGIDYRFLPTAYLKANVAYAEHRYEDINGQLQGSPPVDIDGNIIDTAPRHYGSMQLGKIHSWGLVELEWKHMGPYYLDPEHDWQYEGHDLFNLRMQVWQQSDLKWTARLLNLTDRDYAERADVSIANLPRYFVGEPRSLYVSVEKSF